MLDERIKEKLVTFSIFFGIIIGTMIILVSSILLSRNSWRNGLALSVQEALNEHASGTYTVNKYINLSTPIKTSAAAYSVIKKGQRQNENHYALIIRIPTISGPFPAVFLYNENKGCEFVGYAIKSGKAKNVIRKEISTATIKYWEKRIPKILEKSISKKSSR